MYIFNACKKAGFNDKIGKLLVSIYNFIEVLIINKILLLY
jgi:hypothetical protein